jgi:hypothetical protein
MRGDPYEDPEVLPLSSGDGSDIPSIDGGERGVHPKFKNPKFKN